MKYCIDFYGDLNLDLLNIADEITIDLSKIKDLRDLAEFCKNHQYQRINLKVNDYGEGLDNKFFNFAFDFQEEQKDKYNIVVKLPYYNKILKEKIESNPNIKFYFTFPSFDWDTFNTMIDMKVTDIYIAGAMGFELDKVAEIASNKGIQIRAIPNLAQSTWEETPDLQKFWIRPEDTDIYEEYIDIYEFAYKDYPQQKVYYDIYFNDKKWYGDLKELIIGLKNSLNSTTLLPSFAQRRVNCCRKCMKGGPCHICNAIAHLSGTLEENNLLINIEKTEGEEENGERSNSEGGSSEENIG